MAKNHEVDQALSRAADVEVLYAAARAAREFEDDDIASLEAMSAGPVEMIDSETASESPHASA